MSVLGGNCVWAVRVFVIVDEVVALGECVQVVLARAVGRVFGGLLVGDLCQCGDCALECCVLEIR